MIVRTLCILLISGLCACSRSTLEIRSYRYDETPNIIYEQQIQSLYGRYHLAINRAEAIECQIIGLDETLSLYEAYLRLALIAIRRTWDQNSRDAIDAEIGRRMARKREAFDDYQQRASQMIDVVVRIRGSVDDKILSQSKYLDEIRHLKKEIAKHTRGRSAPRTRSSTSAHSYESKTLREKKAELKDRYESTRDNLQTALTAIIGPLNATEDVRDEEFDRQLTLIDETAGSYADRISKRNFDALPNDQQVAAEEARSQLLEAIKRYEATRSAKREKGCEVAHAGVAAGAPDSRDLSSRALAATVRKNLTDAIRNIRTRNEEDVLRELARFNDLLGSQIDRVQDPTDAAWSEILQPENARNWTKLFARTYYLAEGKSSLVVVRERPGHYRVQRSQNDPAALIKGQLQITQAIGSGLIEIAGAFSGAGPLVSSITSAGSAPSGDDDGAGDTDDDENEAEPVTLEEKKTELETRQRLRAETRRGLITSLEAILSRAEEEPTRTDENAAGTISISLTEDIAAILSAYQKLLASRQANVAAE